MSKMSKVLILGKNGQLAQVFQKLNPKNLTLEFISSQELDLTKPETIGNLFKKHPCDYCINTMAYTNVDQAETEEGSILNEAINNTALEILSKEASKEGVCLIHISTDYAIDPVNSYGKAKKSGENNILANNPNSIVIRTSWLYSDCGKNFYLTMLKLTAEKENLSVIVDQIGTPTNAYDLASTILQIVSLDTDIFKSKVFKLDLQDRVLAFSNSGVTTWFDFAQAINRLAGNNCQIKPIPSTEYPTLANRPKFSVLNSNKLVSLFNLETPKWWFESLQDLIKQ
jgi:dTDP-4-dehydrorhamnose reductase